MDRKKDRSMVTWKQFKDHIDAELKRLGIQEDVEVEYIDLRNSFTINDHPSSDCYIGGNKEGIAIYN